MSLHHVMPKVYSNAWNSAYQWACSWFIPVNTQPGTLLTQIGNRTESTMQFVSSWFGQKVTPVTFFSPFGFEITNSSQSSDQSAQRVLIVADCKHHYVQAIQVPGETALWMHGSKGVKSKTERAKLMCYPIDCVLSADGQLLYILSNSDDVITTLKSATGEFVSVFAFNSSKQFVSASVDKKVNEFGDEVGAFIASEASSTSQVSVGGNARYLARSDSNTSHLFVTEVNASCVTCFDMSTQPPTLVRTFGTRGQRSNGPSGFDTPAAVAVCRQRVFVADTNNNRVQVFDESTGELLHSIQRVDSSVSLSRPSGLCVDRTGGAEKLYIGEAGHHRISVLNIAQPIDNAVVLQATETQIPPPAQYALIGTVAAIDSHDHHVIDPSHLRIDPIAAELFVCDSNQHRYLVYRSF